MLLIGIDEAGYGPTLGPLCHGLSAFRVAEADALPDLWEELTPVVSRAAARSSALQVDDSKRVYSGPDRLNRLRRAVQSFACCVPGVGSATPVLPAELLSAEDLAALELDPWGRAIQCDAEPDAVRGGRRGSRDAVARNALAPTRERADVSGANAGRGGRPEQPCPLPKWGPTTDPSVLAELRAKLAERGIEPVILKAGALDARRYNARLVALGNKADVSWERVGALLCDAIQCAHRGETVRAVVDRQGGRKFYAGRLTELFGVALPGIEMETAERSAYRVTLDGRRVFVEFTEKAERAAFAVALASMAAKLVRELFMERFNAFFLSHDPKLTPTAGYPEDAVRFLQETAELRRRLGIPDEALIRSK